MVFARRDISDEERILGLVLLLYPSEDGALIDQGPVYGSAFSPPSPVPLWSRLTICAAALVTVLVSQAGTIDKRVAEAPPEPKIASRPAASDQGVSASNRVVVEPARRPFRKTAARRRHQPVPADAGRSVLAETETVSARPISINVPIGATALLSAPLTMPLPQTTRPRKETSSEADQGVERHATNESTIVPRSTELRDASDAIRTLRLR